DVLEVFLQFRQGNIFLYAQELLFESGHRCQFEQKRVEDRFLKQRLKSIAFDQNLAREHIHKVEQRLLYLLMFIVEIRAAQVGHFVVPLKQELFYYKQINLFNGRKANKLGSINSVVCSKVTVAKYI